MGNSRSASSRSFGRTALLIFSAALVIRLLHVWSIRDSPFSHLLLGDARVYDAWARQIAGGDLVGHDVFYQAPLYAYSLGALYSIHDGLIWIRTCQAIVGAASCVLLGYAAYRLFGKAAGLAAGLMMAIYAPAVFFDALVQKSVLDVFFVCMVLALLSGPVADPQRVDNGWRWLAVGLALGSLGLTRENALAFVPVVVCWILLRPAKASRSIAGLLAGVAIVLLPVGVRNLMTGGEFHLTTVQSGPNFFIGNHAHADGMYMPLRAGRGSPEYERADAIALASQAAGRALSAGEVSSYWTMRAWEYIRANPTDWLRLEARKLWLISNATEIIDTESQESYEDYSLPLRVLAKVAHFGVLVPLACAGVWCTWNERRRLWLFYAMIAAYTLSVLAFYVVARYRLPLVPLLMLFAAAAIARLRTVRLKPDTTGDKVDAARWGRLSARQLTGVAAVGALAIVCNRPALSADLLRAITYHNVGTAWQEAGRADDAAAAFSRALSLEPDYAAAHNGLGSVLRQQGRASEAIQHLEEAVRLGPDVDEASFNLANALSDAGRTADAIGRYEDLLRRRPDAVDAHANVAIALMRAGRIDDAVEHFRAAAALAPDSAQTQYNLGHALVTRGDLDGGVDQLSRAVAIDPANPAARYELGAAYVAQRRFDLAVEQFREVIRLSPQSGEAHNDLGIALGSLGALDEAIEEFRRALEIDPGSSEARANLQSAIALRQKTTKTR